MTSPRVWRLELAYSKLPLSLNDRRHYMERNRAAVQLRDKVRYLARQHGIPRLDRIHVQLYWTPAVRRTRDADNAVATLKPVIDGLRDYPERKRDGRVIRPAWRGVVVDDDPAHVAWSPPIIRDVDPGELFRLWIDVTDATND